MRSVRPSILACMLGLTLTPFAASAAPPIAAYYSGNIPVEAIPAAKLSYVLYAFAEPNDDNLCARPDAAQRKHFAKLRKLRNAHPNLQLLVSIGGWDAAPQFSDLALTDQSRAAFAQSCIQRYVVQQGFDGIDLDWEFPVHGGTNKSRSSDRKHFTALAQELRKRLDKLGEHNHRHYLLTAATPAARYEQGKKANQGAPYKVTDSYNLKALTPVLDWFNVMTYDMSTIFSPVAGFNTPLRGNPDDPTPKAQREGGNIAAAVALYEAHGVPASKIMLGMAFYGRGFVGVSAKHGGAYSKYKKGYPRQVPWKEIKTSFLTSSHWVRHWSDTAEAPWLYNADKQIFFTYDDPMSMAIKSRFVRKHHLKGAMFWVLGEDDAQHSLLDALASHL